MSEELLDEYIGSPRMAASALSAEHVYENSGHRLLCPSCKEFQRTSIEFVMPGPLLRVTCKVCKTHTDFVIDRDTGFTPKWFADSHRKFAFKQVAKLLGGKNAKS